VSDAIVLERNASAARYFFNACELDVSLRSNEVEKALQRVLIQVPRERRSAVAAEIAQLSGPVEEVAAAIKQREPDISTDLPELGGGGRLGGLVRPGKLAAGRTRFSADGIEVRVPYDLLVRVSIQSHGAGWQMTIEFTTRPTEEAG